MTSFYENKFWQDGDGLRLWQNRLITAVCRVIFPGNRNIFFSELRGYLSGDYEGLYSYVEYTHSGGRQVEVTVEIHGKVLEIFCSDMTYEQGTDKISVEWSKLYCFGASDEDESNASWCVLEAVLGEVQEWVVENIPESTDSSYSNQVSGLVEHLVDLGVKPV